MAIRTQPKIMNKLLQNLKVKLKKYYQNGIFSYFENL